MVFSAKVDTSKKVGGVDDFGTWSHLKQKNKKDY